MEAAGGVRDGIGEAGTGGGYAVLGYELLFPDQVRRLGPGELARIAQGVTGVLDEVYRRRRELSGERTRRLAEDLTAGRVHLFVLLDGARAVVATMAFVKLESIFRDSRVSMYEAGRAVKRIGSPPRLATALIDAAFQWAAGHLDGDYVVAEARVACPEAGRPYNGRILDRVLRNLDFIPAFAAYSHYVAQTEAEPFVWACSAIDSDLWRKNVQQQTIHLPEGEESRMFAGMLDESFSARLAFGGPAPGADERFYGEIRELVEPSPMDESLYILTRHPLPSRRVVGAVPGVTRPDGVRASSGLGDRLLVEEDIVGRPESAQVLGALYREGFSLAGWAPSNYSHGRIALVLTRPGAVPADGVWVAPPDLSALAHLPVTHRFLTHVLARRPLRDVLKVRDAHEVRVGSALVTEALSGRPTA
jgi:hypothetical protein